MTITPDEKLVPAENYSNAVMGVLAKVEFRGSEDENRVINWARILKRGRVVTVQYSGIFNRALAGKLIRAPGVRGGTLVVPGAGGKWEEMPNSNEPGGFNQAREVAEESFITRLLIGSVAIAMNEAEAGQRFRLLLR